MSTPEVVGISRSDHLGISVVKAAREVRTSPKTTKKRIYKHFSNDSFINDVRNAHENGMFSAIYEANDVDKATEIFTNQFSSILDQHAPLRVIQNRSNYLPYLSETIKNTMAQRDKWKEKAAKSGKLFRNEVTYQLRNAEKTYYHQKFDDKDATSGDIWKSAYTLLGTFRSSFPSQLVIFGNLVSKPINLATEMNKFFIQKISALKEGDIDNNDINQEDATD